MKAASVPPAGKKRVSQLPLHKLLARKCGLVLKSLGNGQQSSDSYAKLREANIYTMSVKGVDVGHPILTLSITTG